MSACGLAVATSTTPTKSPTRILIPSSPDLPSPTALLGLREKRISPISRSKPLSGTFSSSFETASSLLRREAAAAATAVSARYQSQAQAQVSGHARETALLDDTRRPKGEVGTIHTTGGSKPEKQRRNRRTNGPRKGEGATERPENDLEDVDGKNCKKQSVSIQSKIGNARITKPSVARDDKKKQAKSAESAVTNADTNPKPTIITIDAYETRVKDLGLTRAVLRRRGWTPTKNADQRTTTAAESGCIEEEQSCSPGLDVSRLEHRSSFSVTKFSFEGDHDTLATAAGPLSRSETPVLKKRKIEVSLCLCLSCNVTADPRCSCSTQSISLRILLNQQNQSHPRRSHRRLRSRQSGRTMPKSLQASPHCFVTSLRRNELVNQERSQEKSRRKLHQ